MANEGSSVARSESLSDIEAFARRVGRSRMTKTGVASRKRVSHATGNRVREMRALRGMSRRNSRAVRHSERFVAQIEAGKGNVSIVRLLRIALVFRCE